MGHYDTASAAAAYKHPSQKAHLASREVLQVIVVGGQVHKPLPLDVCDCPDVVPACQHKLLVEGPLRLVVQACGRVQVHHLVVLHR